MRELRLSIAFVILCLALTGAAQAQVGSDSSEYLIKAGFIYNFAKFVEWPADAFPQPTSPLVIGVLGNDHFATILDQVVDGKQIEGRPFTVKRLRWGKELKDCNILFIAAAESRHGEELINLVKGAAILTIAESPGFAKQGGMINFTLEDSKVRFEVNVAAANGANLNISSRLLTLAKIVQDVTER